MKPISEINAKIIRDSVLKAIDEHEQSNDIHSIDCSYSAGPVPNTSVTFYYNVTRPGDDGYKLESARYIVDFFYETTLSGIIGRDGKTRSLDLGEFLSELKYMFKLLGTDILTEYNIPDYETEVINHDVAV